MIITQELIDGLCPEHSRSSCSDDVPANYGRNSMGWPGCNRCYLLYHLGDDTLELPVKVGIAITPKYEKRVIEVLVEGD